MESQNQFKQSMLGSALSFTFNAFYSNVLSWIAFMLVSLGFLMLGFIGSGFAYFILEFSVPESERPIVIIADTFTKWQLQGFGLNALAIFFAFLSVCYFMATWLGFNRAYIHYYDTGEIKYRPFFNMRAILSSLLSYALLLPLVAGGLILLLIPGIMIFLRSLFMPYFIVDKNMGPIEAIKASWALTKGKYGQLFGLFAILFVCGLIPVIGVYAAGLINVYAYRNISQ